MIRKSSVERVSAPICIRRRFVRVLGRGVHFLRAGVGPPVVLLHSAWASAHAELPLIQRLASDHTVFAFDHPGMGDSDPLSKRNVQIADAADALSATLEVLQIPRCPIYGSHTGGAVALDLALRYPARISALIMDGVILFGPRETKFLSGEGYLAPFTIAGDGSHLLLNWVKTRDAFMWFPWSKRTARNRLLDWPFPTLEGLHGAFVERLRAGDGYRALYGAAFKLDARRAIAALNIPATFMVAAGDLLFAHHDRLPPLKPNQRIGRYPRDPMVYADEKARVLRSYRVQAKAPADIPFRPTPDVVNRRYIDLSGMQILVRSAGEAQRGRPLLLLHEGRASSRVFEPLMRTLAQSRAVYAPDLPDNGASDALIVRRPDIRRYADVVADMAMALKLESCDIYAVGAGATVALDLLRRSKWAKSRVLLEAPDFYTPAFARRLARAWVPPLTLQWDGGHLSQLWLMLRDEHAFWPWFDKSPKAACALDTPRSWDEMHARVTDIVRSLSTYYRLTGAALRYDWRKELRRVRKRQVILMAKAHDPRRSHVQEAANSAGLSDVVIVPASEDAKAKEILNLLRG